jgi:hypothetical protein
VAKPEPRREAPPKLAPKADTPKGAANRRPRT